MAASSFDKKKKFIAQVTKQLDATVTDLSARLLKTIIESVIDQMEVSGGKIVNNSKNLALIATIESLYTKFMGKEGTSIADNIINGAMKIQTFNADYFNDFATSEAKYKASVKQVEKVINDRLGIGDRYTLKPGGYIANLLSDTNVKTQITQLAYREVLKGPGFKEFKKSLGTLIVGNDEKMGAFKQHYRNFAYDSFVQVDRTQSVLLAKDLDLEFFFYEGTVIDSSREFCIKRAGEVFSLEEAQKWESDPWIKNAIEKGYISSYDPIQDMGLFGCRHIPRFVSRETAEAFRPELKKNKPVDADPAEKQKDAPAKAAAFVAAGKKVTGQFSNVEKSVQKMFSKAIDTIDQVHGDGDLKDIPIKKETMSSAAVFASRKADLEPVYIALNPKTTEFAEFALIHEMGHFFDNYSLGKRNAFESDNKKGILKKVIAKATESKAIKGIQEILDRDTIIVDGQEEVMDAGYRDYVKYLVKPTEIWARAYTQFIAKRSGSKPVQHGVEKFFESHLKNGIKAHWDDDDFEEIEKEIEAMMISQGWIKKANPE